jgi:DNA invertase Pin-like site-specific DNA recombinase
VKAGQVKLILATEQERLGRNVAKWEPVVAMLREAGASYDTIRGGGPWDMTEADRRKY